MILSENSVMTQPNLHEIEINYDLSQIGIEMKHGCGGTGQESALVS